jgi:hypothetical protein
MTGWYLTAAFDTALFNNVFIGSGYTTPLGQVDM